MNRDSTTAPQPRTSAGTAIAAVDQAKRAMEAGVPADALVWLRRAARLVPKDATVQLLLASAAIQSDPADAATRLARLCARLPLHREAAMALCAALLRARRPQDAATSLGDMLRRVAPPATASFHQVAAAVCAASGAPGWVGFDGSGRTHVWLASTSPASVRLAVSGQAEARIRWRPGDVVTRALVPHWQTDSSLTAVCDGQPLIGSGLHPRHFGLVDGFAAATAEGGITGWARVPADSDARPALYLNTAAGAPAPVESTVPMPDAQDENEPWQPPRWLFTVPAASLAGLGQAAITDGRGRNLWGSPVMLGAERQATAGASRALAASLAAAPPPPGWTDRFRPLPASLLPVSRQSGAGRQRRPPCDVIVPVYGGLPELQLCLRSLAETLPQATRLVLVNDGSPDPEIAACLRDVAIPGATVLQHALPRGFPAAVNTGLAHVGIGRTRDVIILNADTVVSRRWIERLSEVAHSDSAIGSCTPLSNDGTLVSYPAPDEPGDPSDPADLDALCWAANAAAAVAIPSGVGFCMLIKGACLQEVGPFREDVFAQGYGEENDWCMRAAHLGWRHVAAPGVFVAHSGGRSFGAAKSLLMERNAAVLERLHPGYDSFVREALAAKPLLAARRRIDLLRLLRSGDAPATALVTHDVGGGVGRHVARRRSAIVAAGQRAIVLSPGPEAGTCQLTLDAGGGELALPNLCFTLPAELDDLAAVLRQAKVASMEFHHLLNHDPSVTSLPAALGVPYEVVIHDYGYWCPRISLTSRGQRYCGEPLSPDECEECIADLGSRYPDEVTVRGLRAHSDRFLGEASRVVVACDDVATRIRRQFPAIRPVTVPWEEPAEPGPPVRPARSDIVHVVVVGAIGIEKGYEVLLACGRDAARRDLPLRFTVIGHTVDDDRLMANGRVFVTGRFDEDEGLALLQEQGGTVGFVPSVCPETWCYALSLLWRAGLSVLGFALGAQGERIGRSSHGWLVPLGLAPAKINDTLVSRGLAIIQPSRSTHSTTGMQ